VLKKDREANALGFFVFTYRFSESERQGDREREKKREREKRRDKETATGNRSSPNNRPPGHGHGPQSCVRLPPPLSAHANKEFFGISEEKEW
jgi:hypothetical protein